MSKTVRATVTYESFGRTYPGLDEIADRVSRGTFVRRAADSETMDESLQAIADMVERQFLEEAGLATGAGSFAFSATPISGLSIAGDRN